MTPPTLAGSRSCPNATLWRSSCKRRTCPVCGVRWAKDWHTNLRLNFEHYGEPVVMIVVTAPGAERLPWDEERCSSRRRHRHSGRNGCRIQDRALREWSDTASLRWGMLRRAAAVAVRRRCGEPANVIGRVWEPQKRGAPHLHLVLGYGTAEERATAEAFADELERLSGEYDFGSVYRQFSPREPHAAARYLSAYFLKGSRKDRITETVRNPHLPRGLLWLTVRLTRESGVSIRLLRRARHLWAAVEGFCPGPRWANLEERHNVVGLYFRLYRRRAPPELAAGELELYREVDALERAGTLSWVRPGSLRAEALRAAA